MLTAASLVVVAAMTLAGKGEEPAPTKPVGGGVAGTTCGCPADFDQNGMIDGADLAALLGAWGSPSHDLDGNGITDGADLSVLLGGWGPCIGTPVNDLCADALPIYDGETPFCTIGAGTEVPPFSQSSGCIEFGYDTMTADIWYEFVAPDFGTVTLSTCGVTWDTRLAVYANVLSPIADCPSAQWSLTTEVACNDDYGPCGNGSQVEFSTLPGYHYKIRVGGYLGWSGEGTLLLDFDPIGGSSEDPIYLGSLLPGETFHGTTLDDDHGNDESPCALGDTAAQWHYVGIEGCFGVPEVTFTTCSEDTDFDTTISVWKANVDGSLGAFVACNDDFADPDCQLGSNFRKSRVQFDAPGGGYYYVRVSGYNGARGDFELIYNWTCH
ncbi:MAG: hypothetical protein JNM94_06005 [Phycisphaerae bacterium]|nr:hypothetical protein [Phycisphaerae bacterium]